jgi:hypothetical protein
MARPGGHPGERRTERSHHTGHQPERGLDQRAELLVGLVGVREESGEHLEQDLVAQVEQLGDAPGGRIGQQRLGLRDVEGLAGERGNDRPGRLEVRVLFAQPVVLLPDAEEPGSSPGQPGPVSAHVGVHLHF